MVKVDLKVTFYAIVGILLVLACGCSSKDSSKTVPPAIKKERVLEPMPQSNFSVAGRIDTIQARELEPPQHNSYSHLDLSVNRFYDEGFEQGQEDGYDDGVENLRGDSYDDSCKYRGKARKEYELGYEEGYDTGFDDGFADSGIESEDEE